MPLYEYSCQKGHYAEVLTRLSDREAAVCCCVCGAEMARLPSAPTLGKPAFQSGAILGDGQVIKGHWGKDAPRKRKIKK